MENEQVGIGDRIAAADNPAAVAGNLLELAHALTHAFVLARGDAIQPRHLPISIRQATADGDLQRVLDGDLQALDVVAKRFERDYLLRVLRSVAGVIVLLMSSDAYY